MRSAALVSLLLLFGCPTKSEDLCDDGADNDGDGLFDCDDDDCAATTVCEPTGTTSVTGTSKSDSGYSYDSSYSYDSYYYWYDSGYYGYDTTTGTTAPSIRVDLAWIDDGAFPTDSDGDGILDAGCGDTLDIAITDVLQATQWTFGMADIDAGGWLGEDCLSGAVGTNICHPIGATHRLSEVTDCSASSVVAGSTTLLDTSTDPFLTYFIDDGQDCFVFGNDPAYYASLNCWELN